MNIVAHPANMRTEQMVMQKQNVPQFKIPVQRKISLTGS